MWERYKKKTLSRTILKRYKKKKNTLFNLEKRLKKNIEEDTDSARSDDTDMEDLEKVKKLQGLIRSCL